MLGGEACCPAGDRCGVLGEGAVVPGVPALGPTGWKKKVKSAKENHGGGVGVDGEAICRAGERLPRLAWDSL